MNIDKFQLKIKKNEKKVLEYGKKCNLISLIRLLFMIPSIWYTYKFLRNINNNLYIVLAIISYIGFIFSIKYHKKYKNQLNFSKEMIDINNRYISRINGNWIDFNDIGREFVDVNHRYGTDLDIVGERSLFQLINTTNTLGGRRKLAKFLLQPDYDKKEIILRQEAIKELNKKIDLCENMECITKRYKEKLSDSEKLIEYVKIKNNFIKSKILKKILYIMPLITIPLCVAILIFKLSNLYIVIPIVLVAQIIISVLGFLKLGGILSELVEFKYNLDTYVHILNILKNEKFSSTKLNNINNILFNKESSSIEAIKELGRIAEKVNLRLANPLLYYILNIFLLWDYQCMFSLENWKINRGKNIKSWLDSIAEIEGLMSLTVLTHINDEISFPIIEDLELDIQAKNLGHPLINFKDRVNNDVDMKDEIFIITGSNMSGKTTFLRTIGINLVIAYTGAPVCCKEMQCSIMNIFTSMRITDDLKNGISTFYAELIRIKNIINYSSNNHSMLFLIDEIFRGTNSKDRIIGAKNVLANLNRKGIMGAITTHDLELCELNKQSRIKNYHFSEYYKDNKIYFDYKLKEGESTTTNAKYLMNMVGIKIME